MSFKFLDEELQFCFDSLSDHPSSALLIRSSDRQPSLRCLASKNFPLSSLHAALTLLREVSCNFRREPLESLSSKSDSSEFSELASEGALGDILLLDL